MIYFDNSATSHPKIQSVLDAVYQTMANDNGNPGRSGHKNAKRSAEIIIETRMKLAELFNIDDIMQVVLTKNGTESLNIAINGLLKESDHVITTIYEHNSVLRPLNHLKEEGIIEVDFLRPNEEGLITPDAINQCIKDNTKLIIVNHVSNVVGIRQDIKAIGNIARKKNIVFMVDAAQSAGIIDIDVKRDYIDILAAPGHKGLLGPQGTGFLYVDPKIEINPTSFGGTGSHSFSMNQPMEMPDRLESGTLNTPGIAGLNAGVKYVLDKTVINIENEERKLCDYLLSKLKQIEGIKIYGPLESKNRIPVVGFNYKDYDPGEISYIFDKEFSIASRPGIHCAPLVHKYFKTIDMGGMIRISLNHFNTRAEIDYLIESLIDIELKL